MAARRVRDREPLAHVGNKAEVPEGRLCAGSSTFGIPQHRAPVADFPVQPSGRDGLGRMCRAHWTEYTRALRQASNAANERKGIEPTPTGDPLCQHEVRHRPSS